MTSALWKPDRDKILDTNVAKLMQRVGQPIDLDDVSRSVRRFIRWSQDEPEQFWPAVIDDLGVVW